MFCVFWAVHFHVNDQRTYILDSNLWVNNSTKKKKVLSLDLLKNCHTNVPHCYGILHRLSRFLFHVSVWVVCFGGNICCVLYLEKKPGDARVNPLTPNDPYRGRTAPLTSKRRILYFYSTNIGTEYFKHGIYSPVFFPFQNAVCFIILTYLVPVLFTFYIQGVLKLKKYIIPAPKG